MNITDYPFLVHHNLENQQFCYSLSYKVAEKTTDVKCPVGTWAALLIPAQAVDTLVRLGRAFITPTGCFVAHMNEYWASAQTPKQKSIVVLFGAVGEIVIVLITPINVAIQAVIEVGHLLRATIGTPVGFCAPRSALFFFLSEIDREEAKHATVVDLEESPEDVPPDEPLPNASLMQPSRNFIDTVIELLQQKEITSDFNGENFERYQAYILHSKDTCDKKGTCPLSTLTTLGPALFVTASISEASLKSKAEAEIQMGTLYSYLTEKNRMPAFHLGERTESRGSIQADLSYPETEQYNSYFVSAVTDLLLRTITQESYNGYYNSQQFAYIIHYYSYGIESLCKALQQPFDEDATKDVFWNTLIAKEYVKERFVESQPQE